MGSPVQKGVGQELADKAPLLGDCRQGRPWFLASIIEKRDPVPEESPVSAFFTPPQAGMPLQSDRR